MRVLWVTLSLVVAAQAAHAQVPAPVKLAAPGLSTLNITPEAATYFLDHLGHQLQAQGVEVLTSSEIAALLGLERQRQLLGCTDEQGSCLAEMANALGTDGLVRGSLGKFGKAYQLDLKVLSSGGQTLASFSKKADGDEALLSSLDAGAVALASQLFASLHREAPKALQPAPSVASAPASFRWVWWAVGGLGAAAIVTGVLFMLVPQSPSAQSTAMADVPAAVSQLRFDRQLGLGLAIGGAVALGTSVLLGVLTGKTEPAIALVPTPRGASLVFSGSLP